MKLPTVKHKVKKGENLTKICKDRGFANMAWKKIYKQPYNRTFRKANPDPNVISPGSEFVVPIFSKAQILDAAKAMWVVIYAFHDQQDLYELLLKDLAAAKKKAAKDQEVEADKIRKLIMKIIQQDRVDEAVFRKCRADAKSSLLGDFMGNCERTFDAFHRLNLDHWEKATDALQDTRSITKAKVKAIEQSEKQVKANIAALDKLIKSLGDAAVAVGKMGNESF